MNPTSLAVVAFALSFSASVVSHPHSDHPAETAAQRWLKGTYINQDPAPPLDGIDVKFCPDGKLEFSNGAGRSYEIKTVENQELVIVQSHRTFRFTMSQDRNELFPYDNFTREWLTGVSLKYDPNAIASCQ
uniref:hypothetical protein n=1 Tax=Thaumasiovibrio occultus TaxID=1891184 RepID=UPI000B356957|nr:hypothetical protein [Thaumasiovibrio occultus]